MIVSLGIVAAVGAVRAERYAYYHAPGFLTRQTASYADIQWMNAHLDRLHNRVGSDHKELAYLEVPSILLDSSYQIEISETDKRETLNPPKPNRAAAHNRNGRGRYSSAGDVEGGKS